MPNAISAGAAFRLLPQGRKEDWQERKVKINNLGLCQRQYSYRRLCRLYSASLASLGLSTDGHPSFPVAEVSAMAAGYASPVAIGSVSLG
jgi:hypothetical protein